MIHSNFHLGIPHNRRKDDLVSGHSRRSKGTETSTAGIIVLDVHGKLVSSNHQFADLWGIPANILDSIYEERALQMVIDQLVNPEEFINKVWYFSTAPAEISQDEVLLKDGRTFFRSSIPILDSKGKYFGREWAFRDITERKRSEGLIRQLNADLERQALKLNKHT